MNEPHRAPPICQIRSSALDNCSIQASDSFYTQRYKYFRIGIASDDPELIADLPKNIELDPLTSTLANGDGIKGIRSAEVIGEDVFLGEMIKGQGSTQLPVEKLRLDACLSLFADLRWQGITAHRSAIVEVKSPVRGVPAHLAR